MNLHAANTEWQHVGCLSVLCVIFAVITFDSVIVIKHKFNLYFQIYQSVSSQDTLISQDVRMWKFSIIVL